MKTPSSLAMGKYCFVFLLFACALAFSRSGLSREPITIQVKIQGVEETISKQIQSEISLQRVHPDPAVSESLLDFYIEKSTVEISLILQSYGFYNPNISSKKSFAQSRWTVQFTIDKGSAVIVDAIDIQITGPGQYNPDLKDIRHLMPLTPGDTLTHILYEKGKRELLNKAIGEGYLEAEFIKKRIEVDTQASTASIYLVLETGLLYSFGKTTFSPSALSTTFLDRFLAYQVGDPFTTQKLLNLDDALRKSDYFSEVAVSSSPQAHTLSVPVEVEIIDQKPNHYLLGIGYGTDTGARGKIGYLRRRVNSQGHRFHSEAQLSEIYQKIEADYLIPGKHPQTDYIKLYTQYIEDEYSEKPVNSFEITLSERRNLYGWERILGLSYINESSVAFSTNVSRNDVLLLPFIEFKKSSSDSLNNPTHGKTRIIRLKGAHKNLISDVSFVQLYFQQRWLHTLDHQLKILMRLEIGATLPHKNNDQLPLTQRFFAGGDNSIRGFGYRSLPAEIDKNGIRQPVGGHYLLIGSLEATKSIYGPLGLHVFTDAGNAFRNAQDDVQVGVGTGLSYQTRFGPIKISVAKPLTNAARSIRIHANFGPDIS